MGTEGREPPAARLWPERRATAWLREMDTVTDIHTHSHMACYLNLSREWVAVVGWGSGCTR